MADNEVRKGDFVYRDTLFVNPGGDKRHPRASAAELRELLLPKKGQVPPRDQVAHWYEAQLLHYGLPRTKDKNAAKVRLTSAIAAGNLVVPAYIVQMEADMKKEFATASKRAKAAAHKTMATDLMRGPAPKSKKRKAEGTNDMQAAASSTKMSFMVGNLTVDIDHQEGAVSNPKRRKTAPASTSAKTTKSKTTDNHKNLVEDKMGVVASKQPTSQAKTTRKLDAAGASKPSLKSATTPRPKQTAKKSTGIPTVNQPATKQSAKKGKLPLVSALSPTKQEHKPFSLNDQHDDDVNMDDVPPYSSPGFGYAFSGNEDRKHSRRLQVSGTYTITTPFDDMYCELTIVKNTQTSQFWAHFVAADYKGVLLIPNTDGIATQQALMFNWRAQELHSGLLYFKRDQDGWIQFDGEGGIRGCWNGLLGGDHLKFEGRLDSEPNIEVDELIDQWQWFVERAYGR